jgi:hypothetical protein
MFFIIEWRRPYARQLVAFLGVSRSGGFLATIISQLERSAGFQYAY